VFVSHRGKTFKPTLLEHLAVLSRSGVFVDFLQDPKGVTNRGFMWFNLCTSRFVAILASDDYGESPWCRREYEAGMWLAGAFSEVSLVTFDSIWDLRSYLKVLGYLDYPSRNDKGYQIIRVDFRDTERAGVFEEAGRSAGASSVGARDSRYTDSVRIRQSETRTRFMGLAGFV
jgi:hypothetical protein